MTERMIERYMQDLESQLVGFPPDRKRELIDEVRSHIAEARSELGGEADVGRVLERVGEPGEIASEARERLGIPIRKGGALEIAAIVLLLLGALVIPIFGWFIGVVLLWVSTFWTRREKMIGTFVLPFGLAFPLLLGAFPSTLVTVVSTSGGTPQPGATSLWVFAVSIAGLALTVMAPIFTTVYLVRRYRERNAVAQVAQVA